MTKSLWTNKKHGKKQFKSNYVKTTVPHTGKTERLFQLKTWKKNGEVDLVKSFDSWQAAKAAGWVKV